jgi:hypothetical protein
MGGFSWTGCSGAVFLGELQIPPQIQIALNDQHSFEADIIRATIGLRTRWIQSHLKKAKTKNKKTNSVAFSPKANYNDRAACEISASFCG